MYHGLLNKMLNFCVNDWSNKSIMLLSVEIQFREINDLST